MIRERKDLLYESFRLRPAAGERVHHHKVDQQRTAARLICRKLHLHRRDPVVIGINASGLDHGLVKRTREELEAALDKE